MQFIKASEFKHEDFVTYFVRYIQEDETIQECSGYFNLDIFVLHRFNNFIKERDFDLFKLEILDTSIPSFTKEQVYEMLIDFALAYHKSNNKDIANDAAEYLHDKLNP